MRLSAFDFPLGQILEQAKPQFTQKFNQLKNTSFKRILLNKDEGT